MSRLTGTQRKRLRGLAHSLKPVVHVGQHGLTESVLEEVGHALEAHELIKVKLAGDRDERRRTAEEIARRSGAALAGTIGTLAILYRRHPDPEERRIEL
ncbi:MAG: ribosome assembly RNA-binding protein YhbY [Acidobacteriota bacterium]|jgi:RNA-binding protein